MSRLPPVAALEAFEAAARHMSFLNAARELNVTAGAISRRIQNLESQLGARLFERRHRAIALTAAGESYLAAVREPLAQLAAAGARLRLAAASETLSIVAYPTFAIRWFMPRWGRFHDRHPDIDVRLTTSLAPIDFARGDTDLALQVKEDDWQARGLVAHDLVALDTFPVCAPGLAARLSDPADLAGVTLLHSAPRPDDWPTWLRHAGITGVDGRRGPRFESLNLAFQAAIEGLGVAMGIAAFLGDELEQGTLVRPFDLVRIAHRPVQIIYPAHRADDPRLVAFRDWLLDEAAGVPDRGGASL